MKPEKMWECYCQNNHQINAGYEAWAFGGESNKLAELVVQGVKTATSSLRLLYELEKEALPKAGSYSVIMDSYGDAKCIIKTTNVYVVPFHEVSAAHAYKEGEGDRSLAYWREVHREFFSDCLKEAGLSFRETMDVVCEEFEIVYME